jgi:hypothetical protein
MEDDRREPGAGETPNVPAVPRNFSTPELEAVIRRAVELQAGGTARADDGISEAEVVRIGQELGLEPVAVRRAMAEVRGRPAEDSGALAAVAGPAIVRASRVLRRPAATVAAELDRYLRDTEIMVAQRRFADRTRYVRNPTFAAGLTRITRGISSSHQPINLKQVDVSILPLDAESCLLEASADLAAMRGGITAGVLGSSSVLTAGWAATVWATALADPLMLLGVPALAGAWYGTRAIYGSIARSVEEKLESLLDRVEHDELR